MQKEKNSFHIYDGGVCSEIITSSTISLAVSLPFSLTTKFIKPAMIIDTPPTTRA